MSEPDYIVDIPAMGGEKPSGTPAASSFRGRPWLAIHWRCCAVYSRIYRNADASAYAGRCPRCTRMLRVAIGAGGTSGRFFEAH